MRYKESKELASDLIKFFEGFREKYKFNSLDILVDNAEPGFISNLNTLAREQRKDWLYARPCSKLPIEVRISFSIMLLSNGMFNIRASCKKTLEELSMIAYDEKAEDGRVKLVKQDDHTWDADMYALTPFRNDYTVY